MTASLAFVGSGAFSSICAFTIVLAVSDVLPYCVISGTAYFLASSRSFTLCSIFASVPLRPCCFASSSACVLSSAISFKDLLPSETSNSFLPIRLSYSSTGFALSAPTDFVGSVSAVSFRFLSFLSSCKPTSSASVLPFRTTVNRSFPFSSRPAYLISLPSLVFASTVPSVALFSLVLKPLELIASVMLLTSFISFDFGRSAFGFNVCIVESALSVFARSSLRTFSTFVPSFFTTV